jgi:cytosine permease
VLANVIALLMLYGEILHFVEEWIKLLGVLLSALATTIILDYYVVSRRAAGGAGAGAGAWEPVNWAGVIAILGAVVCAHWLFRPYQPIEVLTSIVAVAVIYLPLRLTVLRPSLQA